MGQTTVEIVENYIPSIRKAISGEGLLRAVTAGAEVLRGYIRINIRGTFDKDPIGNLINSIEIETDHADSHSAAVNVGTNVIYAVIHEFGGIIKAKKKKALHFFIGDEEIFVKSVSMPARPYMRPAVDEHKDDIFAAIEAYLEKEITKAAK